MEYLSKIASRLHSERQRLGLTQDEFAEAGGIGKRAYCNYENGSRECGCEFLHRLAATGADVQFIVTGVYSANLSAVIGLESDDRSEAVVQASLSKRAATLLENYERCTNPMKDALDNTVRAMANRQRIKVTLAVGQIGESMFIEAGKRKSKV